MGLKSQLGWMRHGAERTNASLAAYGAELRELQHKVEALTGAVTRLDATLATINADNTDTVEAIKAQLRAVTEDLGDRLGALSTRLDSSQSG